MARISMRTMVNKTGASYTAGNTTVPYSEDYEVIKDALQDATAGINTQQVEVGGTTVIDSSGDVQDGAGVKPVKESKQGSDCSGSDGATSRVLTLTNTATTTAIFVVVDNAFLIEDQDYTASHKSASSTITFTNRLADASYIEVIRFS
jgi:hypothetical protein